MTETQWSNATTLVLASQSPRGRKWATSAAIAFVRELAAQKSKVVLVDLQVEGGSPALEFGLSEGPGIVDVLFRGANFSGVARKPEGEPFYLLPMGTAPPPRQVLFRHPRWSKIAARLPGADAYLLACVSAADWLEVGPIPGFEASVVLNAAGLEVELPAGARRVAEFLAPPEVREAAGADIDSPASAAASARTPASAGSPAAAAFHHAVDRPSTWRREADGSGSSVPAREEAASQGSDGSEIARRRASSISALASSTGRTAVTASRGRRRRLVPVVATGAALLLLVLWKMLGNDQIADESGRLEAAARIEPVADVEEVPQPRDGEAGGAPVEVVDRAEEVGLSYSVAIASYSSLDDAVARQRAWTRPELPFYVAPTVVRGVVYYRVFAGLESQRERAEDLMRRLVQDGTKDALRDWDVRPAHLAFYFGRYGDRAEAEDMVATLLEQRIPAYTVPAAAAGEEAYHVYAGGYENPEDARPLREQITDAGLESKLVERVGLVLP